MNEPIAKKSLGQHWLNDRGVLEAMCDAAHVTTGDEVLEIGPGTGSLTGMLMERDANIFAIEVDDEAIRYLQKIYARQWDVCLHVEQGDIRTFNLTRMPKGYKLVANIPYYLTSHLIQILSESANPPSVAALLVQKEVAERVCADPGNMSILSITSQFYWRTSLGQKVGAELFTPPPKVDSQILILERRVEPMFDVDQKLFFRMVKSGFSAKRKTLHNSLSAGLRIEKTATLQLLQLAHVLPESRPQELSLEDWYRLYSVAFSNGMI